MQIVDNDYRNNLVKFDKIHCTILSPFEINDDVYFTQNFTWLQCLFKNSGGDTDSVFKCKWSPHLNVG